MSRRFAAGAVGLLLLATATQAIQCGEEAGAPASDSRGRAEVPVVGGPCEGCELVFEGMPALVRSQSRIAPLDEPGEPMRIEGTVVDQAGRPAPGTIVYAYHTDAGGLYPRGEVRHGRLRGWAVADDHGSYAFDTIRPASYPDSDIPAHVHLHVIEPDCCTYYIADIEFTDDPLLTEALRARANSRGGPGIATPERGEDGVWRVRRDIVLGQEISDYP